MQQIPKVLLIRLHLIILRRNEFKRYINRQKLGCAEGWLVVFDKRVKIGWSKKLFFRKKKVNDKEITIVGG